MFRSNKINKGSIVGLITGGAVGAVAALLSAPKSGKALRGNIKARVKGYSSDAEKHLENAKEKAMEIISDGKKEGEQIVSDAKVKAEKLLKDAEKIFDQAKQKNK